MYTVAAEAAHEQREIEHICLYEKGVCVCVCVCVYICLSVCLYVPLCVLQYACNYYMHTGTYIVYISLCYLLIRLTNTSSCHYSMYDVLLLTYTIQLLGWMHMLQLQWEQTIPCFVR